jgi:hypothetical protein
MHRCHWRKHSFSRARVRIAPMQPRMQARTSIANTCACVCVTQVCPGGSGNAVAKSVLALGGEPCDFTSAAWAVVKGRRCGCDTLSFASVENCARVSGPLQRFCRLAHTCNLLAAFGSVACCACGPPTACSEWDWLSALSAQETAWRTHLIHPSLLVWREIDRSPLLSLNRTPHTPAHKRTSKAFAFAFARSARREALFRNPVALVGARLRHRQSESCRMHDTT